MSSVARKLVSGSILRVINLLVGLAVSFFLTPFIIHSLGDRSYGLWVLVGTFIGYYGLLDLGLSNAVGRFISKAIGEKDNKTINEVYNTGFALFLIGGALALGLTLIGAALTPYFVDNPEELNTFRWVLLILGIHSAIDLPMRVFHGLLYARLRFDSIAYVELLNLLIRTALIVVAIQMGYGLIGLAVATFIANLPCNLLYIFFAYKNFPGLKLNLRLVSRGVVKLLFSYSFFVFILQVSRQISFQADAFVLTALMSLSAVAHYNIASMLLQHFDVLMGRLMGVLTPYFSQLEGANDTEQMQKTLFFSTKLSVIVSSFIGFGFIVWGGDFIHRWMGQDYLDAYPCLVVLIGGMIFSLWQNPSIALLYGTSKHKFLALVTIIEGFSNLGLSILLVPHYGILGAALGTAVPLLIHKVLIQPIYVCRVSVLPLGDYLRNLGRAALGVCLALMLPYFLAGKFSAPDYLHLLFLAASSFALYLPIVWFLVFNRPERVMLMQMIGGRFRRTRAVDV